MRELIILNEYDISEGEFPNFSYRLRDFETHLKGTLSIVDFREDAQKLFPDLDFCENTTGERIYSLPDQTAEKFKNIYYKPDIEVLRHGLISAAIKITTGLAKSKPENLDEMVPLIYRWAEQTASVVETSDRVSHAARHDRAKFFKLYQHEMSQLKTWIKNKGC